MNDHASPLTRENVAALILGAGEGQRLGLGPKALLYFEGQTLLERAVASVAPLAAQVIGGVREADSTVARRLLESEAFRDSLGTNSTYIQLIIGGATRQETILRLAQCATKPFTLLHEVARPFVSHAHLSSLLQNVAQTGAVASYVPLEARDAVAIYEGSTLRQTLPRNRLIAVQAPQAYKTAMLLDAYRRVASAEPEHVPDATPGVVAAAGYEVRLIEGDAANIKLTYAQDAVLLQNRLT
jgi:2-C-methyl-D-erythritol 4-phosphate cytidylyltransferase